MQNFDGGVEIVSLATVFLLLVTGAPIVFVLLHQRQYHLYLRDKETIKNNYERELLKSQLEIQNQTLQQIGQELHDNIGQLLTVAVMRLNNLETQVDSGAQLSVVQTRELIRTVIADIRTLSKTLDFDTVRRFGLLPSLSLELERIQRTGRIQAQLTTSGEPYSLGEQTEVVLLRMAQESLNNALKHAQAHSLTVSTTYEPNLFLLIIADDGRGFSVKDAVGRPLEQAGAGLGNLYRRAGLLGGTCTVVSEVGAGTRVEIRLGR